uniref:SAP domain-containing protein n=1 Tax=Bactrocera dorsalis TaxID=27457 RepID=A0A034VYS8_BACDO
MPRLLDLSVRQLKKELEARQLLTKGNKSKLQTRLLQSMEARGENSETYEFADMVSKNDNELQALAVFDNETRTAVSMGMTTLLSAIAGVQESLIQNTAQVDDIQQRIADDIVKNSAQLKERVQDSATLLEERIQQNALVMGERAYADLAKWRLNLSVHLKKLEERLLHIEAINGQLSARQEKLERDCQKSHPKVENEIQATDRNVDRHNINVCGNEILDNNLPKVVNTSHLSPPIFDGTMPISIFKLQFEMSVKLYKWNDVEKLAALVLAIKGPATAILQTFANMTDLNYEAVMGELERRYGSEHWRQINNMQLVNRVQKPNETILDYANDIERLSNLVYANSSKDLLETTKIQSFIRGLRDCEIKLAMYSMPKSTFMETLSYAITRKVALDLAGPKLNCNDN